MDGVGDNRRESIYALLLVCALVVIILLPWHAQNHRIPIWDEASFIETAQIILDRFKGGWWEGLQNLYLFRNWRPIIFPVIVSFFLAVAKGQIIPAVGLTQWFSLTLIGIYTFFLLREFLSVPRALCGTLFVVTTPWILSFAYVLYSELFWLAATVAFASHLVAGRARRPRLHLAFAGFWLGLMGATRPAETVLVLVIPVLLLILRDWRARVITPIDIAIVLVQAAIVTVVAFRSIQIGSIDWLSACLLAAFAAIIALSARRVFIRAPLLGMIVIVEVIFVAWHLPSMRELYLWAYETSFGSMAKLPYGSFTGSSPKALLNALSNAFNISFIALIGLLCGAAMLASRVVARLDVALWRAAKLVLLAVLMLAPMVVMLWITGTMDTRRVMPGMLILYVGIAALTLFPHPVLPRLRLALFTALAIVQFGVATANAMNWRIQTIDRVQDLVGRLMPPAAGPDANVVVIEHLIEMGARSGGVAVYTLCYREPIVQCTPRGYPMIEPVAMSTLARERGLPMYLNFPTDLDFSKPETLVAQLNRRGYGMVLVDMFDKPERVASADPLFDHAFQFMALIKNGLPTNMSVIGKFSFGGREFYLLDAGSRSR